MYGSVDPIKPHRAALPVELDVPCPTCDAPKGRPCGLFIWRSSGADNEHCGTPHNLRYRAAGIDPWAAA